MKQHLLGILLAVAACFAVLPTTHAQTDGDIVDRLNKALLVKLPAEFEAKVKEFAANDTIMRTRSATAFTEQFIIEQFKKDWGIDRQNQLLFMWSKIYGGISQKKLYNWLDDDNNDRSGDYKKCLKNISEFYESYKKGFKEYMNAGIADADRRIADADRRIADADRASAEALKKGLNAAIDFYNCYQIDPTYFDGLSQKRRENINSTVKAIMQLCKEFNIDYKAILRHGLGDDEKVKDLLKFYGVE